MNCYNDSKFSSSALKVSVNFKKDAVKSSFRNYAPDSLINDYTGENGVTKFKFRVRFVFWFLFSLWFIFGCINHFWLYLSITLFIIIGNSFTKWEFYYIDTETGNLKDELASKKHKENNKLCDQFYQEGKHANTIEDYENASKKFSTTYDKCSKYNVNENLYKESLNNSESNKGKIEEIIDHVKEGAYQFYKEGINAYNNQNYAEAFDKFNKAYDTCSMSDIKRKNYKYSRDHTALVIDELMISELKAESKIKYKLRTCELYIRAVDELKNKCFVEALNKFIKGYCNTIKNTLRIK
jgi:outer membrane protein assembly factor BamD (BamD/ComL family)